MTSINHRMQNWCENHNIPAFFRDSVESTNAWAKKDFKSTDLIAVYLADHQTQGRGRGTNTWTNSTPGATLLSTWCLHLEGTPQPIFAIRTGLLLWEVLQTVWPQIPWALKAPNDIYVGSGKFAGILIEVEQQLQDITAFIGIGANIESAPDVPDQKTFTLTSHASAQIETTWGAYCNSMIKGLFELRKDAHRSNLTAREIDRLRTGLNLFPGNAIKEVLADGGLVLKNNDHIHWNEL